MGNEKVIGSAELMDSVLRALHDKLPFSIVSVGQTEAIVIAQDQFDVNDTLREYKFILEKETFIANLGRKEGFEHRGIRLPNRSLQEETINAVKRADIVGYNLLEPVAKKITETAFDIFNIHPQFIFEANIRRALMFSQRDKYNEMLRDRRILLIGSLAPAAKKSLEDTLQNKLNFTISGAIPMFEYFEMEDVKRQIDQYQFDLCLLSAGTNATILAPYIAQKHGKVAIDIGSSIKSLISGEIVTDEWIEDVIGLDRLLSL